MNDYKSTINGLTIDYELLGKVLMAKRARTNYPVMESVDKYCKRVLSLCKTIYPDGKIVRY